MFTQKPLKKSFSMEIPSVTLIKPLRKKFCVVSKQYTYKSAKGFLLFNISTQCIAWEIFFGWIKNIFKIPRIYTSITLLYAEHHGIGQFF